MARLNQNATKGGAPRSPAFRFLLVTALAALMLLFAPSAALAHGFAIEAVSLNFVKGKVSGVGHVSFSEIGLVDSNGDGKIDSQEVGAQFVTTSTKLLDALQKQCVITINGKRLSIVAAWINTAAYSSGTTPAASEYVSIALVTSKFDADASNVSVDWSFTSPSKSVILRTSDAALIANLDDQNQTTFNLNVWSATASFFALGIEHIALGFDHLLFLAVLTLGVFKTGITKRNTIRAIKLVSAFTVGHALSFTLAYFNLFSIPAAIVEPLIALSIVVTAIAAATKSDWERFWFLASIIGLVHGLGFASSLSKLGIATSQHAAAIISFNIGIDVAQVVAVAAVALVLGLATRLFARKIKALKLVALAVIGLFGLIWTVARIAEPISQIWPYLF